jgi:hypothetical protein
MLCRALLGVGLGAKASVTPLFCAEVSPSNLRGTLVINWQIFDAAGIFLGKCAQEVIVPLVRCASDVPLKRMLIYVSNR